MFNDSFDENEPKTREELIQHGKNIGAAYVLICIDSDPQIDPQVVYVSYDQDVGKLEKDCWRSSFHVETINLRN